jgi:hypothetical protein
MVLRSFLILAHAQVMQLIWNPIESKSTQVEFTPQCEVENLRYHCKVLNLKLKRMTEKYNNCLSKLKDLEVENGKNSKFLKLAENISEGVENNDEKAVFLTNVMKNVCRKNP